MLVCNLCLVLSHSVLEVVMFLYSLDSSHVCPPVVPVTLDLICLVYLPCLSYLLIWMLFIFFLSLHNAFPSHLLLSFHSIALLQFKLYFFKAQFPSFYNNLANSEANKLQKMYFLDNILKNTEFDHFLRFNLTFYNGVTEIWIDMSGLLLIRPSFNITFIKRNLISIGRKMSAMWYKLQLWEILMLM